MSKNQLQLLNDDPWLSPYKEEINGRYDRFETTLKDIKEQAGSLENFANAYDFLGLNYNKEAKGWFYREWAPEAINLALIGDFNDWDDSSHVLEKNQNTGVWEIFIAGKFNFLKIWITDFPLGVANNVILFFRLEINFLPFLEFKNSKPNLYPKFNLEF